MRSGGILPPRELAYLFMRWLIKTRRQDAAATDTPRKLFHDNASGFYGIK